MKIMKGQLSIIAEMVKILIVIISLLYCVVCSEWEASFPKTVLEDAHLDTFELLKKYKYPGETHFATTEDNYVLRLHRIARPGARPLLLVHGLLDSSFTWIAMGPENGLGYYLYEEGYDVWMGNVRGNTYSRNHTKLDPDTNNEFWTFCWHEIGIYDLPAMIDYVLNNTGKSQLGYFGHSQGTTAFWVMASMRPEYHAKITIMSALAPVAFCNHVKVRYKMFGRNLAAMMQGITREFLPYSDLYYNTCLRSKATEIACWEMIGDVFGKDRREINMTLSPVLLGHMPNGCNFKQMQHYAQLLTSGRFCQYDYGPNENQKRYHSDIPPNYPLERINVSVGLYYALNDHLSSEVDVQRLAKLLPRVVENMLYPYKSWNHVSMLWGITARKAAHEHMVEVMRKHEFN